MGVLFSLAARCAVLLLSDRNVTKLLLEERSGLVVGS
tara:strand:+ start:1233 stop:1343 length:111 start_codon:yes stop_codon:yes gene_type:complete